MHAAANDVPTRGRLLTIFAVAVALRALLFVAAILIGFAPSRIFRMRDGSGYLHYAEAIVNGREGFAGLEAYDRRVFPGFPAIVALLRLAGLPGGPAAVALNWCSAGAAAALVAALYRNFRLGLAMAVLTPSYLMYTTVVMSEATLMAAIVGSLVLATRDRPVRAGLLEGVAILIRPFAFVGAFAVLARFRQRPRMLVLYGLATAAVGAAAMALMWTWSGSIAPAVAIQARGPHGYNGEIFTWPFRSLILTPLTTHIPLWKTAYVWLHVLAVLGGCALLFLELKRGTDEPLVAMSAAWLAANTITILCIGADGGFREFHRFVTPALPPLFFAYRRWLPQGAAGWSAIAVASWAMAFRGLSHGW